MGAGKSATPEVSLETVERKFGRDEAHFFGPFQNLFSVFELFDPFDPYNSLVQNFQAFY